MSDFRKRSERVVEVQGNSPEELATRLVRILGGIGGTAGEERNARTVVPIQAAGATLAEMLYALTDDALDAIESSPTQVLDAEIAQVMMAGDGVRAWGYLWFGTEPQAIASPSPSGPPVVTERPDGELSVRVILPVSDAPIGNGVSMTKAEDAR
jgi:hypothetical protein